MTIYHVVICETDLPEYAVKIIVRNTCLPLAVKAAGSVLHAMQKSGSVWRNIAG